MIPLRITAPLKFQHSGLGKKGKCSYTNEMITMYILKVVEMSFCSVNYWYLGN
jgi:hypothetical protein